LGFGTLLVRQVDALQPAGRNAGSAQRRRHGLAVDSEAFGELVCAVAGLVGVQQGVDLLVRQLIEAAGEVSAGFDSDQVSEPRSAPESSLTCGSATLGGLRSIAGRPPG